MKKVLIGLSFLVALALISVYIFIPAQLHITEASVMKTNTNALFRYLSNGANWNKWWPGKGREQKSTDENNHEFDGYTYRLTEKLYNAIDVGIIKNNDSINSKIAIIPLAEDSLIVQWNTAVLPTSRNPITRIGQYQQAINIKKNIAIILDSLKSFTENKERVYKYHIRHTTLTDTLLAAIKTVTTSYPSTPVIYRQIENLRKCITAQGGRDVGYPILNITKKDSLHYDMMIAIPTNIAISENGNISSKRMIAYKDKILTADVTGGLENIKKAYNELNIYMSDYNLVSPVIHWETLITDRSKQPDSTKWITKICIPIV